MAPQQIKSRLEAVKNVGQITKAMEVVSATKMRRAQETALASRQYAYHALELLDIIMHKRHMSSLGQARPVKTTLVVLVASDRGLAGAFNSQISRTLDAFLAADEFSKVIEHDYVAAIVGKRGLAPILKKQIEVVSEFFGYGDKATVEEVEPLSKFITNGFNSGRWDRVVVISTHFRTTLRQDTLVRQLLPLDLEQLRQTINEVVPEHGRYAALRDKEPQEIGEETEYILEPDSETLIKNFIPHLVETELYQSILEANASEHSARMVAMKTASDNAGELSGDLLLEYNKARQAAITKEILEITGTQNALG